MQGTPPPRQEIGSVWDDAVPQPPAQAPNAGMPGAQIYNIPMNAGQMYVFPKTTASTALGLSIAGLALGFFCFPLCGLLAVPGFFMSQSSLNITNSMPGHPDASTAKSARIISLITMALMVLAVALFVLLIAFEASNPGTL